MITITLKYNNVSILQSDTKETEKRVDDDDSVISGNEESDEGSELQLRR